MSEVNFELCRYYKGEDKCPKNVKASFWEYERKWVELSLDASSALEGMLAEYISNGLGAFEQTDNTPISLKAFLFNRYAHWNAGDLISGFKKWYKSSYIGLTN